MGPPPPPLVRFPDPPADATSFQTAQHRRALEAAQSTNRARLAAWRSVAARLVAPWQQHVVAQLRSIAGSLAGSDAGGPTDVATSLVAAATTLAGLPGRRVLLVLDAAEDGSPVATLPAGSLAGVDLVVANLPDATATAAWTRVVAGAGAPVTMLDAVLAELRLPSVVNGDPPGGEG